MTRKLLTESEEAKSFVGLERGIDYQVCPSLSCHRKVELAAACNHIACVCGIGFCFVCGEEADAASTHWERGGCSRYGHPSDPKARYDDEEEGEGSEMGEESEDEGMQDEEFRTRGNLV